MLTQDEVRQKLIQKMQERQQQYIAKQIGIPKQILSNFKTGKRELWQSSLQALNDYLDSHWWNQSDSLIWHRQYHAYGIYSEKSNFNQSSQYQAEEPIKDNWIMKKNWIWNLWISRTNVLKVLQLRCGGGIIVVKLRE